MKVILEKEFGAQVRWVEEASNNTRENALLSQRMLAKSGVATILLVTHAWHMPRAQGAFERVGLKVIPAGTRFSPPTALELMDFVPNAGALRSSAYAMHEAIGLVWYRLRG
jgi:uncharacterized SAM-binding protein YcdF (DUF218 family)